MQITKLIHFQNAQIHGQLLKTSLLAYSFPIFHVQTMSTRHTHGIIWPHLLSSCSPLIFGRLYGYITKPYDTFKNCSSATIPLNIDFALMFFDLDNFFGRTLPTHFMFMFPLDMFLSLLDNCPNTLLDGFPHTSPISIINHIISIHIQSIKFTCCHDVFSRVTNHSKTWNATLCVEHHPCLWMTSWCLTSLHHCSKRRSLLALVQLL